LWGGLQMSEERVERRLAAILAADVAGYSRLMGKDEAGTLARLRSHRRELIDPKITEHKGRVVKTSGDGILIEFPSVVEAVACAVGVQRGMSERNAAVANDQRIAFRIGINLGDVIVDDGDIHGNGVNVAARLEALAEPGGICISGIVHDQVQDRLDCTFEDIGEPELKNISRPVRVYRVRSGACAQPVASPPGFSHSRREDAEGGPQRSERFSAPLALPDKPSVAVLPFANMSSDPEHEFLAAGIAEDIITALSRYPSLFVIARNSCFTYKGHAVEVRQVGRELGVRYVLEGSLRRAGNRIRVTAQLVEAETGNHVWAERYDRSLADIFAVQDEITEAVTIAIAQAEQQRAMRKPPGSLDAWAAYQRGLWHFAKATAGDNLTAQKFFQQAADLDPNFACSYTGLYWTYALATVIFQTCDLAEGRHSMNVSARRAVALDSGNAEAHAALGNFLNLSGGRADAIAENELALAISPNLAVAHFSYGCTLTSAGRPREGLANLQRYLRLDPRDPLLFGGLHMIAQAHYACHEYEEAVEAARRAIRAYPDFPPTYRWLAAALGQLGRAQEAKAALDTAIALLPTQIVTFARNPPGWFSPESHDHFLEGLRKAGWEG
jgi:adenylate cyclase